MTTDALTAEQYRALEQVFDRRDRQDVPFTRKRLFVDRDPGDEREDDDEDNAD